MKKFSFPSEKKLPHFMGSMKLTGPRGMCFHRSVGLVLDIPIAKLCVGTFRGATPEELKHFPNYSDVPFIHCWVEIGKSVYAPTTIEHLGRLTPFNREEYYHLNEAKDVRYMSRATLLRLSREHGLAQHLLDFSPLKGDSKFASVILDELGVSYALTDRGGLVPGE